MTKKKKLMLSGKWLVKRSEKLLMHIISKEWLPRLQKGEPSAVILLLVTAVEFYRLLSQHRISALGSIIASKYIYEAFIYKDILKIIVKSKDNIVLTKNTLLFLIETWYTWLVMPDK